MRSLNKLAIKRGIIRFDPASMVKPIKTRSTGYHTWSIDEIQQFEEHHGVGSQAVLILRLALYTGAPRKDLCRMGWQHFKAGRVRYTRNKTEQAVDLSIHPRLAEVLEFVDKDKLQFFEFKTEEVLANFFRDRRKEAGLSHGSIHGLRKTGAVLQAENGATESEIAAYLGHSSTKEAQTYKRAADTAKLGTGAITKM